MSQKELIDKQKKSELDTSEFTKESDESTKDNTKEIPVSAQKTQSSQKKKMLSPKLDVVFQAIFGAEGSENITKDFLEKVLDRKIEKIELDKNPILLREFKDDKLGILDLKTQLNENEICNVELQVVNKHNIKERILFYWAKIYAGQLKAGYEYGKLKPTIVVLIADFKIEGLEAEEYHSRWKIMSEKHHRLILTSMLQIDIIELPKIKGKENIKDQLIDWLMFFENVESERVVQGMEENKNLKEAVEKLEKISEDEKMQRLSELREKAIRDEKAVYLHGVEIGEKNGKAEGIELGKKEGIALGRTEGKLENQIEVAKKMLKEKIDMELISKISELTKEEIEKLKKDDEN